MPNMVYTIKNTIPISLFNKGLAGKIFEEVKQCGSKVVMKNNVAECVLLSPDEYVALMDELNDARLLLLANKRMEKADISAAISAEDVYRDLGITQEDLIGFDEVEIE